MLGDSAGLHRSPLEAEDLSVVFIRFRVRRVAAASDAHSQRPAAPTLPPADAPPCLAVPRPPPPPSQPPRLAPPRGSSGLGPYAGDFKVATWNAQGLFAACPQVRREKGAHVRRLLRDHDVVIVTETHSTPEVEALNTRAGQAYFGEFPAFWAHGSSARAGVGMIATAAFLRRFALQSDWYVLVPGRAGELRLNGDKGDLSIFAVYFATGSHESDDEDDAITARVSRQRLRRSVVTHIEPSSRRLSLLMGDFNWVADDLGRLQVDGHLPSGGRGRSEEQHLGQQLHGTDMVLWRHTAYTHQHQGVLSRLDRCYANLHPSCFLNERVGTAALDWVRSESTGHLLSTHRAISAFRCAPPGSRDGDSGRALPPEMGNCPAWKDRTRLLFSDKIANDTRSMAASPFGRLRLLKEAMVEAAIGLQRAVPRELPQDDTEGRLSWCMRGLQGVARQDRDLLLKMAAAVPEVAPCLALPPLEARRFLQDAAYGFAKTAARDQLEAVQAAAKTGEAEGAVRGLRHRAMQTLRRLRPRAEQALSAIQLPDGSITTDPQRAAPTLVRHWAEHFRAKGVRNLVALEPWFEAMPSFAEVLPECEVTADHVRHALKAAGATAPGPDGIPYSFWRGIGEVGVEVLTDTMQAMMVEGSEETMVREYGSGDNRFGPCDFNGSLLALLPKKPTGQDPTAGTFYCPADTRPLMLVDTSNRLLASALRFAIEPAIERLVGASQRGFLRGRSILANVLDFEASMQVAALEDDMAYALLFDMRAAFSSLEHDYLHHVLDKLGLPRGVRAAIRALYTGQRCCLAMAGQWWEGFDITAGIRQGCPLSPLLFVLVTEPFNRQFDAIEGR